MPSQFQMSPTSRGLLRNCPRPYDIEIAKFVDIAQQVLW